MSRTPARITEPAVGASTWASGSQECSGHTGTLMAKAAAKPQNNSPCMAAGTPLAMMAGTEKVPMLMPSHRMASSIRIEPAMVYRKNLIAA